MWSYKLFEILSNEAIFEQKAVSVQLMLSPYKSESRLVFSRVLCHSCTVSFLKVIYATVWNFKFDLGETYKFQNTAWKVKKRKNV